MKKGKLLLVTLLMATVSSASLLFAACEPENGHTHTYGEWTIQTAPTESTPGKAERNCVAGDGSEELDLPVLTDEEFWAHTNTPATHSADGADTYVNAEHGITYTKPITALGHVWGAWQFVEGQTPTRTAGGKAERKCEDFATDAGREEKILPKLTDSSFWTETITQPASPTEAGKANYSNSEYGLTVNDVEIPATAEPAQQVTFTVKTDSEAAGQSLTLEVGASLKAALDALLEDVSKPGMHFVKWTIEGGVDVGAQDTVSAALSGKTITGVWEDDADYAGTYYGREFEGLGSAPSTDLATLTIDESGAVTFTVAGDGNASMAFSGSVEGYDAASQIISVSGGKYIFFDSVSGLIAVNADPSQNKIGAHFVLLSKEATADNGASLGTFHVGLKSQPAGEAAADYYTHFVVVDGEAVLIHENKIYTGLTLTDGYGDALAAFTGAAATWSADVETIVAKTADGEEVLAVYAKNGDSPSTFQYGVCAPLDAYHGSYTVGSGKVQLDGAGRIKYTKGGTPYKGTYKVESGKDYTLLATITDEVPEGDPTIYKVTVAGDSLTIAAAQTVIHFNMGIGTGSIGDKTVNTGSKVYLEAAENEADKIFVGWYTDSGLSEESKLPTDEQESKTVYVIENIQGDEYTVYAKWEESILITFNAGEGHFKNSENTLTVKVNAGYALPTADHLTVLDGYEEPTQDGKVFVGWYQTSEDELFGGMEEVEAGFTLNAKYVDKQAYMQKYVFVIIDGPREDVADEYSGSAVPRFGDGSVLDLSHGSEAKLTYMGDHVVASPFSGNVTVTVTAFDGNAGTITIKISKHENGKPDVDTEINGTYDKESGMIVADASNKDSAKWSQIYVFTPFETVEYKVEKVEEATEDAQVVDKGVVHNSLNADANPKTPEQAAKKRILAATWRHNSGYYYAVSYKTSDGTAHNVFVGEEKVYFDVTFADVKGAEITIEDGPDANAEAISKGATVVIKQSSGDVIKTYGYNGETLVETDGLEGIYTHDPSDENEDLGQLTITGVSGYMGGAILGSETCKYSVDDPSGKIVIVTKQDDSFYKITLNTENDTYTYELTTDKITLNLGGKSVEGYNTSVEFTTGQPVEIPVPTTDGFIFGGWYEDAGFSSSKKVEPIGGNFYVFEEATTLYAKWLEAKKFTIVAGNDLPDQELTLGVGTAMYPTTPAYGFANNKSFDGWYTNPQCTTKWNGYGVGISTDTTIYAKWKEGVPFAGEWHGKEYYGATATGSSGGNGLTIKANGEASGQISAEANSYKYDPVTGIIEFTASGGVRVGAYSPDAHVLAINFSNGAGNLRGDIYIYVDTTGEDNTTGISSSSGFKWKNKENNDSMILDLVCHDPADNTTVLVYNNRIYSALTLKSKTGSNLTATQASSESEIHVYAKDGTRLFVITGSGTDRTVSDGLNATYTKGEVGEDLGSVVLDGNGGATIKSSVKATYTLAAANAGYTIGLSVGNPVSEYYQLTLDTSHHTYFAEKPMAKITYKVEGDTLTHDADSVNVNVPFALPVIDNGSIVTTGWFYDEDCTKPVVLTNGKYVPTADITLYSKTADLVQITIVWTVGGHSQEANTVIAVAKGTIPDLTQYIPETAADGYVFDNWYTDDSCSELYTPTEVNDSTTIYCGWKKEDPYEITINKDGLYVEDNGTWKWTLTSTSQSVTFKITFKKTGLVSFYFKAYMGDDDSGSCDGYIKKNGSSTLVTQSGTTLYLWNAFSGNVYSEMTSNYTTKDITVNAGDYIEISISSAKNSNSKDSSAYIQVSDIQFTAT